ncbi:MAG: prepilin-type N-terminal cleavage/methylation domain-containing protein [Planctomycetota bacterium]
MASLTPRFASRPTRRATAPQQRGGFTLLEVILAIGILAAAVAVVGEVTRLSYVNAELAAMEGDALIVAESVMAQIVAGLLDPAELPPTAWDEGDPSADAMWQYSVAVTALEIDELLAVTVRVEEARPADKEPIAVSLTRWLLDPDQVPETPDGEAAL